MPPKTLSPELLDLLLGKDWPGNIRELENTIIVVTTATVIRRSVIPRVTVAASVI